MRKDNKENKELVRPSTPSPFDISVGKIRRLPGETITEHKQTNGIKSSISEVLASARATISNPSRPYTPRETMAQRKLFYEQDYSNRPSSALSINSSSFKILAPIRPPSQEETRNTQRESEEESQQKQVWNGVQALLQLMDPENSSERIMQAADSLYMILVARHDEFSENQQRIILQRVSKLMDNQDSLVLFKLTAIILQLSPDGPFLLSTCKLLFSLSKKHECDIMFRQEKVLDPLIKLLRNQKQEKSWETWLYTIAALKNISTDSTENQQILLSYRVISVLSNIIQLVDQEFPTNDEDATNRYAQLLVQVTALLRNLSSSSKSYRQFVKYGVLENLHKCMINLYTHAEFIHNCGRILSKISVNAECRKLMVVHPYVPYLIKVLEYHKLNKPIVIRACFVLGNLTFADDRGNLSVELIQQMQYIEKKIPLLLDLLELYDNHEKKRSDERIKKETEDLLTKLIRLIANVALHEQLGITVVESPKIARLIGLMERKSVTKCEELVLNIVRCITNLSFYALAQNNDKILCPLFADQVKISQLLAPLLLYDHPDAVLESTRAFGNLTRNEQVREWMKESRVDEVMMILIDHTRLDIVHSICGILINLTNDNKGRHIQIFMQCSIIDRLMEVLDRADINLVSLILQVMHNLSLVPDMFTQEQLAHLYETLQEMIIHLQEEIEAEPKDRDPYYDSSAVTELQTIATNLLRQLNTLN